MTAKAPTPMSENAIRPKAPSAPPKIDKCSCGLRNKNKCVRESDNGYGKMCLKD